MTIEATKKNAPPQVGEHNYFNILSQDILRYSRHKNGRIAPLYNYFCNAEDREIHKKKILK